MVERLNSCLAKIAALLAAVAIGFSPGCRLIRARLIKGGGQAIVSSDPTVRMDMVKSYPGNLRRLTDS